MREIIPVVYALNLVNLKTAQFHIFKSCFLGFVKGNILHTLVVTKSKGNERLICYAVGPTVIEYHKMTAGLVSHIFKEVI